MFLNEIINWSSREFASQLTKYKMFLAQVVSKLLGDLHVLINFLMCAAIERDLLLYKLKLVAPEEQRPRKREKTSCCEV